MKNNNEFIRFLRMAARIRTMLLRLIFVASISFAMGIGCDANSANPSPGDFFFPVQKEGLAQMLTLAKGRLVIENSCLRLKPIIGSSYLLIWPYGYSLHTEGKIIEVIDGNGNIVAHVGDTIKVGGGEAVSVEIVMIYTSQQLPDNCEGPYWLVNEVVNK
ncbi:MAG: hypothetical protein MUO97_08235 [Dehalococcoidia bacterium]|nr:hypothetical protein [Dehalococcoidia bacterium]